MKYHIIIDSFIGPWAYSKQVIRNALKPLQGKHVDILISSPGGSVDHGFDIMQQFKDHGDVTVYLSGLVASAATIIAMGAKRVVMTKASAFMIHQCSNFIDIWGSYNADQMQKLIDDLAQNKKDNEKIDVVIANVYADKCNKKVSEILPVLKKGGWMTPQEARDFGFVDEISDPAPDDPKLDLSNEALDRLNVLGIPTAGLTADRFNAIPDSFDAGSANVESDHSDTATNSHNNIMNKFNFSTVESLLKLDAIQVDKDGEVTVSAENFEKINNRIAELENALKEKTDAVAAKDAEIATLTEQVKNLNEGPGDHTTDIEDESGAKEDLTALDLFNSIKSAL